MIKKFSLIGAVAAMTASAILPTAAADAQRSRGYDQRYEQRYYEREYRGDDGYSRYRARQKCKDGDGGTIIGAIAGGLLGRTIDSRGDRLLGTVLGAGAGALAGRAIDRSDRPDYCRR